MTLTVVSGTGKSRKVKSKEEEGEGRKEKQMVGGGVGWGYNRSSCHGSPRIQCLRFSIISLPSSLLV